VPPHREQRAVPGDDNARRIHHVGITVAQLNRSLVFYRDLLGMAVIGRSEDEDVGAIVGLPGARVRAADLDAGNGQVVELLEYRSPNGDRGACGPDTVGTCHLSLQVADLRSALSRLASRGFMPVGQPAKLAGGGVWQDCTVVYVRDPDGVFVELIERGAGA
jgi:catechol 2,3-dioxygenase-like lactoylglutathione lyase family enzyme